MTRRAWLTAAGLALTVLLPRASFAGMMTPCSAPAMFPGARVTVFVFPYVDHTSAESAKTESPVGTELAGLIQADTLLSISRFGNVAAIRLLGSPQDCKPAQVLADLLSIFGSNDVRSAVVMLWGRIFRVNDNLYVQSYASFQRFQPKDPGEMIELPFVGATLAGRLSAQTIAFAPRRVSDADLEQIKARYAQSNIVHEQPDENVPGKPLLMMFPNARRPAYYLTEVKGDWIHIQAQSGQSGWLLARAVVGDQRLSTRLPEMRFVEGVAGYFAVRATPAAATAEIALGALRAFEESQKGASADEARVVSTQLRGLITLLAGGQSDRAFADAAALFRQAATDLPSDAAAVNLAAMVSLYSDWRARDAPIDFQAAADRFWASMSSDPTDPISLANCWTLFNVAQLPDYRDRFRFPETVRVSDLAAQSQAFKTVEVGGRPAQLAHAKAVVPWPSP